MNTKTRICLLVLLSFFLGCKHSKQIEKIPLLLADREAPVGWVILSIYEDSTFEYTSGGRRNITDYTGHIEIRNDTLHFHYNDSIPAVGSIAVIENNYVVYIAGTYKEHIEIKLNKLK